MDTEDTPTERPPLLENVPYIQCVGQLCLQLSALNANLAGAVHEMRVARFPVEASSLASKMRAAFKALKAIAIGGEDAFATSAPVTTNTNGVPK